MPRISPFNGLVFDPAVAGPLDQVTAPPYDVISDQGRLDYLMASPYSVVHLDLAEGAGDPGDPESRYARAARLLADWEARGVLVRSPEAQYYVYEMGFPQDPRVGGPPSPDAGHRHVLRGLLCAMDLEPWGGAVLPHERTMEGPIQDRLHLLRATRTHVSAVYGTIAGPCEPLASLLQTVTSTPASASVTAGDGQGVVHRMWPIAPSAEIATWLAPDALLIADGHHRYTTALRYRDERHGTDGPGPWDRVLTLIVDSTTQRLPVLPFHRVQLAGAMPDPSGLRRDGRELAGLSEALAVCSDDDVVVATVRRDGDGSIRYDALPLAGEAPAVRALHDEVLDRLVPPGSFRFVHDADLADEAVRSGGAVGAYLLPPTTPDRIRKATDRGQRLPQKSTYFWPKPLTGMVMMPLDPPAAGPSAAPAS